MAEYKDGVGIGTTLEMENGTPGTFAPIGRISNISGPNLSVNIVEKTTLDDEFARKVPGRIDGGDVTFDLELDPTATDHKGIVATIKERKVRNFKIKLPSPWDSTVFAFSGIISDFSTTVDDEGLSASVTISVTGEPDFGEDV